MTIVFILRHFKDNFSLHLMLNLAASDILFLLTAPVWTYILLHEWIFGSAFCKVIFTVGYIALNSSVFTVTLMSVQRYLVVLHRDRWAKLGRKGERFLLLCIWLLACLLSIPSTVTSDIEEVGSKLKCHRLSRSDGERMTILLLEFLLSFVFPFSILVICYCRLYTKVNRSTFFRNQRLTKLVTRIVVLFFIFSFPLYFMYPVQIISLALKPSQPAVSQKICKFYLPFLNAATGLIYINSCVNPLLYAFASKKMFEGVEKPKKVGEV